MKLEVTIRGIYATALTKLLSEGGFSVAKPSPMIAKRFSLSRGLRTEGVKIRDKEDRQGVIVFGDKDQVELAIYTMRKRLPDAVVRNKTLIAFHQARREGAKAFPLASGFAFEVEFPFESKRLLDEIRRKRVPTLSGHHQFKVVASSELDKAEEELAQHPEKRDELTKELKQRLVLAGYTKGKSLRIEHVKPNGEVLWLSEGEIIEFDPEEMRLVLKRTGFKGRSAYDGLEVAKAEGDYAVTTAKEASWILHHAYHSVDHHLKGDFYNINTPIEFYPDRIRYLDLEVDVVRWPNGETGIVDKEKLDDVVAQDFISSEVAAKAMETAEKLRSSIQQGLVLNDQY